MINMGYMEGFTSWGRLTIKVIKLDGLVEFT